MKIERFEDLVAWQEAPKLMNMTYDTTDDPAFNKDTDLKRHVRRTSVQVMATISEGFGRYSPKDSKKFYIETRGSLTEFKSHWYVALDRHFTSKEAFDNIYNQAEYVCKLVNGLIGASLRLMNSKQLTNQ